MEIYKLKKLSDTEINEIAITLLGKNLFSETDEKSFSEILALGGSRKSMSFYLQKIINETLSKHFSNNSFEKLRYWADYYNLDYGILLLVLKGKSLLEKKHLNQNEIEELENTLISGITDNLGRYYIELQSELLLRKNSLLNISSKVQILEKWILSCQKRRRTAIVLTVKNYDVIVERSPILRRQIRYIAGNHYFKKQVAETNLLINSALNYFDNITHSNRLNLVECLMKSMNDGTERAARRLFSRKFNKLNKDFKNRILTHIITNFNLPHYYLRSFLYENREKVSDFNKELIVEELEGSIPKKLEIKTEGNNA